MDMNEKLQLFTQEMPRYIWDLLEGKCNVAIDIVKGQNCQEFPVIVVYKENDESYAPFVRELFDAFATMETVYEGSFEKYAEGFVSELKRRDDFCLGQ